MIRRSFRSKIFDFSNHIFLMIFAVATIFPFMHIIASSFATPEEVLSSTFLLFPRHLSLQAYRYIFSTGTLIRCLLNTIYITSLGTIVNLTMTILMAYPLAHSNIVGRKQIMLGVTFTLLFSGGMIPGFLVVKSLGLMNSYWAVILPGAINAFNMIILKNFFQQLPTELEESAEIDGANEFVVLIRIILPLSMPAIATFTLFYAVAHWNSFFSAVLYLNDAEKWPIQVLLRQVVLMAQGGIGDSTSFDSEVVIPPQTVKMATIAISTAPVLAFYPLLQRHFTKGILVGSIKG